MSKRHIIFALVAMSPSVLFATTYIKQGNLAGRIGTAIGKGLAQSMEESRLIEQERRLRESVIEQERQVRNQQQLERRITKEVNYYHSVVSKMSCSPTHPTLTLPDDSMQVFVDKSHIKMSDNRTMGCLFKMKLNRVLSDGAFVEWVWSLGISNETQKKLFSFGAMEYSTLRFKIELVDANNFAVSSCIYYANVFLKRGENTTLEGKWMVPYDQLPRLSSYRLAIGYP